MPDRVELRLLPGGRAERSEPVVRGWRRALAPLRPFFPRSADTPVDLPAVRSTLAHDNPAWAVSNRENAVRAWRIHRDCDHTRCSTLVASIIVTRNDFEYFRDGERKRARRRRFRR